VGHLVLGAFGLDSANHALGMDAAWRAGASDRHLGDFIAPLLPCVSAMYAHRLGGAVRKLPRQLQRLRTRA
jgi:hypothetical protein